MAPKLTGGTSIVGVTAYQDDQDPSQFHYVPDRAPLILGETLTSFSATYWGIGDRFLRQTPSGQIESVVGATLAGEVTLDISADQRRQLVSELRRVYGTDTPRLIPLQIQNVEIQPIVATQTLQLGEGSDVDFPQQIQFGSSFAFLVGSGDSLFAGYVGEQTVGTELTPNPNFGVNIVGEAEFVGDPWEVRVTADLSRVWSFTRRKFESGVNFGWFRLSLGEYEETIQELVQEQIVTLDFIEGSLDNERYGRQILEMGRDIFDAVNSAIDSGTGLFGFEPDPEPMSSSNPNSGTGWPFRPRLNLGYSSETIRSSQSTMFQQTIRYTGRVIRKIPSSMTLAVSCNQATASFFRDLGASAEPCITPEKTAILQDRLGEEFDRKQRLTQILEDRLLLGDITNEEYQERINLLNGATTSEDLAPLAAPEGFVPTPGLPSGVLFAAAPTPAAVAPRALAPLGEDSAPAPRNGVVHQAGANVVNQASKSLRRETFSLEGGRWIAEPPERIGEDTDITLLARRDTLDRPMSGSATYTVRNFTEANGVLTVNFSLDSAVSGRFEANTNDTLPEPATSIRRGGDELIYEVTVSRT